MGKNKKTPTTIEQGRRIREIRRAKGISASEIDVLLGYKCKIVYCWENGQKVPLIKRTELAQALDCEVSDIFGPKSRSASKPTAAPTVVPAASTTKKPAPARKSSEAVVKVGTQRNMMSGQIWTIESPAGRFEMFVIAEAGDTVTGMILTKEIEGYMPVFVCGKWADVAAIISKPKSYLGKKIGTATDEEMSRLHDLICEYFGIKPRVEEKIVERKADTEKIESLEMEIVRLKARLFDFMSA